MRATGIVSVTVLAVTLLVAVGAERAPSAQAASASDFSAGYLVSDDNFYDGGAMGAWDVQNFLVSRNSTCRSTFACLYAYRQSTPSMPGDSYCSPIGGMSS